MSMSPPFVPSAWPVLVIADTAASDLAASVVLAGFTIAARHSLAVPSPEDGALSTVAAVLIDLRDASDDLVDAAMSRADRYREANHAPIVAAIAPGQVDAVAARWLGASYQLLCDPTVAEIAVALVSARSRARPSRVATEDESERLRQLNSEVARIAETLARLTQAEAERSRDATAARDRSMVFRAEPAGTGQVDAARKIRTLIRARRLRDSHFPAELFADPAWDMLLDLYAADLEGQRVSVSSLCIAASVPSTTALRWIGTMIELGLLERHADPLDRRRAYIVMSEHARDSMQRYFDALKRGGLAVP